MAGRRRGTRRTNLGLLVLLISAAATGLLAFAIGTPTASRVVVLAHGASGLALLVLARPKGLLVRRARNRPVAPRRSLAGPALGALVGVCVLTGVTHSLGATGPYLGVTTLQVHVGSAIAAAVPLLAHLLAHPVVARRSDLSRRSALRAAAVGAVGVLGWFAVETTAAAAGLPGARRRATGSYERGSGDPARMPTTQWISDRVQRLGDDHVLVVRRGVTAVGAGPLTWPTARPSPPCSTAPAAGTPPRSGPAPRWAISWPTSCRPRTRGGGSPWTSSRSPATGGGSRCATPAPCCSPPTSPAPPFLRATVVRFDWSPPAVGASGG